jgi:hypothetical protein
VNRDIEHLLTELGASDVPALDPAFADRLERTLRTGVVGGGTASVLSIRRSGRWPATAAAVAFAASIVAVGLMVWNDQAPKQIYVTEAANAEVVLPTGQALPAVPGLVLEPGSLVRTFDNGQITFGDVILGPNRSAVVDDSGIDEAATVAMAADPAEDGSVDTDRIAGPSEVPDTGQQGNGSGGSTPSNPTATSTATTTIATTSTSVPAVIPTTVAPATTAPTVSTMLAGPTTTTVARSTSTTVDPAVVTTQATTTTIDDDPVAATTTTAAGTGASTSTSTTSTTAVSTTTTSTTAAPSTTTTTSPTTTTSTTIKEPTTPTSAVPSDGGKQNVQSQSDGPLIRLQMGSIVAIG